jgi:hypothetical protein
MNLYRAAHVHGVSHISIHNQEESHVMSNDDQLQALERLAKLRDSGALTEEEFAAKKAAILNETASVHAPWYRRLWFVVLLTCLVLTFPIALIILVTGDVYKKADGVRVPIGNKTRYIYASILGLWLAAAIIRSIMYPDDWTTASNQKAPVASPSQSASSESPATNPAPPPRPQSANNSNQPQQAANGPGMTVEMAPTEAPKMIVTGDDDQPFTITRIIYNGRASQTGCDYPDFEPKLPQAYQALQDVVPESQRTPAKTLRRGEQAVYYPSCGKILSVEIQTDRGTSQYKFDN